MLRVLYGVAASPVAFIFVAVVAYNVSAIKYGIRRAKCTIRVPENIYWYITHYYYYFILYSTIDVNYIALQRRERVKKRLLKHTMKNNMLNIFFRQRKEEIAREMKCMKRNCEMLFILCRAKQFSSRSTKQQESWKKHVFIRRMCALSSTTIE